MHLQCHRCSCWPAMACAPQTQAFLLWFYFIWYSLKETGWCSYNFKYHIWYVLYASTIRTPPSIHRKQLLFWLIIYENQISIYCFTHLKLKEFSPEYFWLHHYFSSTYFRCTGHTAIVIWHLALHINVVISNAVYWVIGVFLEAIFLHQNS